MLGTLDKTPQLDIFRKPLKHLIPENDELVMLAVKVEWEKIASGLSKHYSPDKGRKAIPVRKLAGLLILKEIYGGSDKSILSQCSENLSFQYFCGEVYPQKKPPASRSDLVKFRSRIGPGGMDIIFTSTLLQHIKHTRERLKEKEKEKEKPGWQIRRFFRNLFPGLRKS